MFKPLVVALAPALTIAALPAGPALARPDGKAAIVKQVRAELLRDDISEHDPVAIAAQVTPIDINGDGIQDWQVDWNMYGPLWCGTGGCRYQLWLGRKAGPPLKVFDRRVRAHERLTRGGRIVFSFDFHGIYCDRTGAEACPGLFAWSPRRGRMIALPIAGQVSAKGSPIERSQ